FDENAARDLKARVHDLSVQVSYGMDGLCEAASLPGVNLVCNSVVGMIGLLPTLTAVRSGKNVALANKETLVAGGALVMKEAAEKGVSILPVDSEHSAIFQCLQGSPGKEAVKKLILTASGGPFFGKKREELRTVTPQQALKHPNWNMGPKVTIDSATMMNKGLEIMEAGWLFDMPGDRIDVVVHRESVIHSMIEYVDHSVIAQMGVPDMRIPIQYAILYPQRLPSPVEPLSLTKYGTLTFFEPDMETFRCLAACRMAIRRGGLAPAAANGANEAAVQLFLQEKIGFLDIGELVMQAMLEQEDAPCDSVESVWQADRLARERVYRMAGV
ncbi:MAG: 1-deoxy-D-xylulose-5-phosphate reductoisomerase, partial [Candidatus Heritagella sp.]